MRYLVLLLIILVLGACSYIPSLLDDSTTESESQQTEGDRDVDYQASFAVFINNVKRDFTLPMFYEQSPRAYITSRFPGFVQVKKAPTTWGQFFNSLPITLDYTCLQTHDRQQLCTDDNKTLKFFLNGDRVYDLLDREIQPNDRVLVSYGNESGVLIERQINQIPSSR